MADRSEGRRAVFIWCSGCRLGVLPAQQVVLGALKTGLGVARFAFTSPNLLKHFQGRQNVGLKNSPSKNV